MEYIVHAMSMGLFSIGNAVGMLCKKGSSSLGHMLLVIVGDRSCDHATPRQMALLEEEIVVSATFKDTTPGVIEEFCRNSNFSMFS